MLAPPAYSMISAMNPQTIIVPKSGWRKISAMGMAASTTASSNRRHDSPRPWPGRALRRG